MCGIAGSTSLEYLQLCHQENIKRGCQSYGKLSLIRHKDHVITSCFRAIKEQPTFKELNVPQTQTFYLLHTRAPTNYSSQDPRYYQTHPFYSDPWFVAHNGILTRFPEKYRNIQQKYVDTEIIARELSYQYYQTKSTENSLINTFTLFGEFSNNLFSCWIYNRITQDLYLVKAGSSLYILEENNGNMSTFSTSIPEVLQEHKRWRSILDGQIHKWDWKRQYFAQVADFPYRSAFRI